MRLLLLLLSPLLLLMLLILVLLLVRFILVLVLVLLLLLMQIREVSPHVLAFRQCQVSRRRHDSKRGGFHAPPRVTRGSRGAEAAVRS
jgi:hypothetical protein